MHKITIIESVFKDLSKIEYALRAENIDNKVIDILTIVIIQLYHTSIYNNQDQYHLNVDTLSDIYFTILRYPPSQKKQYQNIIKDITARMRAVIKK